MSLPEAAKAFSRVALQYDRWYEGNPLFESEVLAVRALGELAFPQLEVGVGTGQFARALNLSFGLDPSFEMLCLAKEKGLKVVCGLAERLPFRDQSLGSLLFLFTFCFLEHPEQALEEAHRVLRREGQLVIGFINRDSPWGQWYQEKAASGHPLYRLARFRNFSEIKELAEEKGFRWLKGVSTLRQLPQETPRVEEPKDGVVEGAGFIVCLFVR